MHLRLLPLFRKSLQAARRHIIMGTSTPATTPANHVRIRLIRGHNNRSAGFCYDCPAGEADALVRFRKAEYAPDEPYTSYERRIQEQAAALAAEELARRKADEQAADDLARRKASANALRGQG